ncbi:hypothetical protein BGZ58_005385 [Dissophora ornata]|nr:hypothetical protein BGZ58_005385 [Dissophora ornata]
MTKRTSISNADAVKDIDMETVAQSSKKIKVDQADYAYPQDKYTIKSETLKSSRFEVLYMAYRARAEVPRLLLEYVGATYTSAIPVDWPAGKKETPFGLLPVLTHYKANGAAFTVAQVPALMRYLGRLFELTGETLEDDAILDACFECAHEDVLNTIHMEIWVKSDPKSKECIDSAFEKLVPLFDGVERYLVKNGSNGYLLGEKTTYAEFPWYDWMSYFYSEYPEHMNALVSETVRPGLRTLYERLDSNPRIRAYIDGGRWEYRPSPPMVGLYSTGVVVSEWEPAYEFYAKTLGLLTVSNVQPEHTGPDGRYIEFIVNAQERTKFTVYSAGKSSEEKHDMPKHNTGISFTVRNVQETHDRLVKKGVEFKMPPTKMPWGSMAQFADPDGNILTINEAPQNVGK